MSSPNPLSADPTVRTPFVGRGDPLNRRGGAKVNLRAAAHLAGRDVQQVLAPVGTNVPVPNPQEASKTAASPPAPDVYSLENISTASGGSGGLLPVTPPSIAGGGSQGNSPIVPKNLENAFNRV